jgi:hypothetical protein
VASNAASTLLPPPSIAGQLSFDSILRRPSTALPNLLKGASSLPSIAELSDEAPPPPPPTNAASQYQLQQLPTSEDLGRSAGLVRLLVEALPVGGEGGGSTDTTVHAKARQKQELRAASNFGSLADIQKELKEMAVRLHRNEENDVKTNQRNKKSMLFSKSSTLGQMAPQGADQKTRSDQFEAKTDARFIEIEKTRKERRQKRIKPLIL